MAQQELNGRDTVNSAVAPEAGDTVKRPYVRPSLVLFGAVATLTAGVSKSFGESGNEGQRGPNLPP